MYIRQERSEAPLGKKFHWFLFIALMRIRNPWVARCCLLHGDNAE